MDREFLILIAVGPDQVGLVEKISDFIKHQECNIEDSKMAVLAGEFAYMMLISGNGRQINEIAASYKELSAQTGLDVFVRKPMRKKSAEAALPYRLTASCMDHPGVVHRLSTTMSARGINIVSMETKTHAAPDSGTPIFRMEAVVSVPPSVNIAGLRSQLEQIEREENIDIHLGLVNE